MSTRAVSVIALGALCLAGTAASAAETPDSENGRYTFSTTADGVMRLDTRTGAISNCSNSSSGWACYATPDERKALDDEIGRLQAENGRLKAQLAARDPAAGKSAEAAPGGADNRKIEIPLPSDQDMDRMMAFAEQAWRRLIDMANRVQKDMSGKI